MAGYAPEIKLAVAGVMVLGAIAFVNHDRLLRQRRASALWQDDQHRLLWLLLGLGVGVIALERYGFAGRFSWVDSLFQWVSSLTTCGFSAEPVQFMSPSHKLWLAAAMVIGGTAGSTVGGIKLQRLVILLRAVTWRFRRTGLRPHEIMDYQLNGDHLSEKEASRQVESAAVLAFLWVVAVLLGVLILVRLVPSEYGLSDVVFEVASALGSAGLTTGITSPSMAWGGKVLLIALMWMGRLEIIPVLLLLSLPVRWLTQVPKGLPKGH